MRRFLAGFYGFVLALVLLAGFAAVVVYAGFFPAGADVKPSKFERRVAKTALNAAIRRDTQGLTDPYPPTDRSLSAAIKLYGKNCAFCHGTSDAEPSKAAQGFNVRAPQLAKDGVEDDPLQVTFWKVKHGIRFTGMPAFGGTLHDEEIWALAGFLRHMDRLPSKLDAEWRALPSAR
jgi:mono/diheme cytochrome c family protein